MVGGDAAAPSRAAARPAAEITTRPPVACEEDSVTEPDTRWMHRREGCAPAASPPCTIRTAEPFEQVTFDNSAGGRGAGSASAGAGAAGPDEGKGRREGIESSG